jgi:replicative DNA helicase
MASGGGLSGKTTGLASIDEKTSGLHNSDLVIVAGRPGMGKSSLATNIAFNCAEEHLRHQREGGPFNYGAPVALFSLEMSADQLATRILAEQAEISSESLRSGKITREEFQKLSFASQRLAELPLYIDDTRIGLDRAGRRHGLVHLPRRLLQGGPAPRHAGAGVLARSAGEIQQVGSGISRGPQQGDTDRGQAAPRLDRPGPAAVPRRDH